jgi:large subunit ribosomal protein L9
MKLLLLEDVYNLGRAGDIKKVASGYGRNFLIPQGMATPATANAVLQAERIAADADKRRNILNEELGTVAEQVKEVQLLFPARAGETGKLYGSVTTQMIAEQLSSEINREVDKRQIHGQPLRLLGMHDVAVRLTLDLIPEFSVVVYREGENPENYMIAAEELAKDAQQTIESEVSEEDEADAEEVESSEESVETDEEKEESVDTEKEEEEIEAAEEGDTESAE